MVDRRKPKQDGNGQDDQKGDGGAKDSAPKPAIKKTWPDRLYMYTPPANCNRIADDSVPESFFNASKECLLPGKGYAAGKGGSEQTQTIDVGTPMGGFQFTLSFHVRAADDIKCYLFHHGQISRFYPQDMVDLWPIWFEGSGLLDEANKKWLEGKDKYGNTEWKESMNYVQTLLSDAQFEKWFEDTTKGQFGKLLKKY